MKPIHKFYLDCESETHTIDLTLLLKEIYNVIGRFYKGRETIKLHIASAHSTTK